MVKEQFIDFVRCFSKRRSNQQKNKFIENVKNLFTELGYMVTVTEKSMGLKKIKNINIGDINKAKTIYIAGYDTTEQMIFNNFNYYPFKTDHNLRFYLFNTIMRFLISLVLSLAGIYILYNTANVQLFHRIIMIILGLIFIGSGALFSYGISNNANFSKSVSIFLILRLAREYRSSSIAFVLCDQASYSEMGLSVLADDIVQINEKRFIYLDCLATGERLMLCSNEKNMLESMADYYQESNLSKIDFINKDETRFKMFNRLMVICAGNLDQDNELYVTKVQTEKDCEVDITLMESVFKMLNEYNKTLT